MRKIIPMLIAALLITACTTLDCPMNNTVSVRFALRGLVDTLADTLTIMAVRPDKDDSTLFNRGVETTHFLLPMSYSQDEDELRFEMIDTITKTVTTDIVKIQKTNQPHFESVDCNPAFFHTITGVTHTKNAIDSVVINNPNVDTDETKEHLYIYFHPHY